MERKQKAIERGDSGEADLMERYKNLIFNKNEDLKKYNDDLLSIDEVIEKLKQEQPKTATSNAKETEFRAQRERLRAKKFAREKKLLDVVLEGFNELKSKCSDDLTLLEKEIENLEQKQK